MPIVYLNKRQKVELVARFAKVKGLARAVKQLRDAVNFAELEDLQERNQEILEKLAADKIITAVNANISKALASKYGVVTMFWNDPPEKVEIDKSLLEIVRAKWPKEEDLDGGEWTVLELKDELDRAWEDAKSNNKKMGEETKSDRQETANA
jgi:hypothetical protein